MGRGWRARGGEEGGGRPRHTPSEWDAASELPGSVYFVPDRLWGFDAAGRTDHPGVCVEYVERSLHAMMLKGTDADSPRVARLPRAYVIVAPDDDNGLGKPTAFELSLRRLSSRHVVLMHQDRRAGSVGAEVLERMRAELRRVFARRRR